MAEVTGFFHGGITVKDMDKSLDFYHYGLGLTMKFDRILDASYLNVVLALTHKAIRVVFLDIPGGGYVEFYEKGSKRIEALLSSQAQSLFE